MRDLIRRLHRLGYSPERIEMTLARRAYAVGLVVVLITLKTAPPALSAGGLRCGRMGV